jgi:hypothetical protein
MNEGSVIEDTGTFPVQDSSEESLEVRDEGQPESQNEEDTPTSEGGEEDQQFTEKGTKLDPNPLSQAHQLLANERRVRQQYEQVLNSPELLKKYAQQYGMTLTEAKAEIKEEAKSFTPDRFKTAQDVAEALNEVYGDVRTLKEENQRLQGELRGLSGSRQVERVANTMKQDIDTIREKYPELNPKSPEFNKDLEREIGSLYQEVDFDPEAGVFRGKVSLAKLTDQVMKAASKAREQGSQKAQTDVKVKQAGRVVTSSKSTSSEVGESKDPSTAIAQRIAKAMKG